jgi:hypothetical protein
MKVTRRQIRRIIREVYDITREDVENYLTDRARAYHKDRALDLDGDGIPDAPAIRELLQDDLIDNIAGSWNPEDFRDLIDKLSDTSPDEVSFRGPDPSTHRRLRQQTRTQGGYTGAGAWKTRTPNK